MVAAVLNWRKITSDLLLAGSANFFRKLVSYVVIVMLARYLHKDEIGALFFAASIATFAAVFTELGTTRYLTREIAPDPARAPAALSEVLTLRLPLMGVTLSILSVVVWLFYRQIWLAVSLSTLYVFLQSLFFSFSAVFLAMRDVRYRVVADIASQVVLIVLVFLAVRWEAGLGVVLGCYVAADLALVSLAIYTFLTRIGPLGIRWDLRVFRRMLEQSLPFFVLMSLSVLHFKIDTLMLGLMTSLETVANYEIAYKFLEVSRFIVRPVAMIFLPIGTALVVQQAWPVFRSLVRRLLIGTAVLAVAGAALVVAGAPMIMDLVFGPTYASSAAILQVLFLALPAVYVVFVGSVLGNALYLEKKMIRITLVCLIANVLTNLYAIPRWGGLGAAWTTLATEMLLAVWTLVLLAAGLRRAQSGQAAAAEASERAYAEVVDDTDSLP